MARQMRWALSAAELSALRAHTEKRAWPFTFSYDTSAHDVIPSLVGNGVFIESVVFHDVGAGSHGVGLTLTLDDGAGGDSESFTLGATRGNGGAQWVGGIVDPIKTKPGTRVRVTAAPNAGGSNPSTVSGTIIGYYVRAATNSVKDNVAP